MPGAAIAALNGERHRTVNVSARSTLLTFALQIAEKDKARIAVRAFSKTDHGASTHMTSYPHDISFGLTESQEANSVSPNFRCDEIPELVPNAFAPALKRKLKPKGTGECTWCNQLRVRKGYCYFHNVLHDIRSTARRERKFVPTIAQIESMILQQRGNCAACRARMEIRGGNRNPRTMSLQHNNDGTLCMLCRSCNAVHRHIGDEIYSGWSQVAGYAYELGLPIELAKIFRRNAEAIRKTDRKSIDPEYRVREKQRSAAWARRKAAERRQNGEGK